MSAVEGTPGGPSTGTPGGPSTGGPGGPAAPPPTPQGGWGELRAQLHEWREAIDRLLPPWWNRALVAT
ncbi:MAG TPA: hypothetical protein VE983_04430, partial [Solirubrobacteraceae bacterium]|nr:hypothetical protein [Solirubrobacteraceae bacterium]